MNVKNLNNYLKQKRKFRRLQFIQQLNLIYTFVYSNLFQ